MSNQPEIPVTSYPDEAASTAQTDQGVPVGDADVQADIDRASGESEDEGEREPDTLDFAEKAQPHLTTDQGATVGHADAEADRQRAAEEE